jgi:hypothetical protein
VPVVHSYNPSYSEGRDQENGYPKAAGKEFERPYLRKKPITKKGC